MTRHITHILTSEMEADIIKLSITFYNPHTKEQVLRAIYQNKMLAVQNQLFFQPNEEQVTWVRNDRYSFFILQSLERKALRLLKDELPGLSRTLNLQTNHV